MHAYYIFIYVHMCVYVCVFVQSYNNMEGNDKLWILDSGFLYPGGKEKNAEGYRGDFIFPWNKSGISKRAMTKY